MAGAAAEELPEGPGSLVRARLLLAGPSQDALRRVISRSIAIGSGKGGVGKTITACNLAIFYARKGLRVGLVDLDPLSDVASLLDLYESEQAVRDASASSQSPAALPRWTETSCPSFKKLDILFPYQKLSAGASARSDGKDLPAPSSRRSTSATTC